MDIQAIEHYLNIDASKYNEPSLEALNYYIKRYMLTVPFENINVQNGVPISVEINDLYDKLINQQRGGFCYEMNHFFGTYLEEKGLPYIVCLRLLNSLMAIAVQKVHTCHLLFQLMM